MTDFEANKINEIQNMIIEGKLSGAFLVANLQLSIDYLNLVRVKDYAKSINKSEWGVRRVYKNKIVKICNYQLVIDD